MPCVVDAGLARSGVAMVVLSLCRAKQARHKRASGTVKVSESSSTSGVEGGGGTRTESDDGEDFRSGTAL